MSNIDLNDAGRDPDDGVEPGALANIGAEEQDLMLAADGIAKARRSGPLILIGVVVLAAGSLFSMRTLTRVHAKTEVASNPVVEKYLKGASDGQEQTAKEVLSQLSDVKPAEREFSRDLFAVTNKDPEEERETVVVVQGTTEAQWQAACKKGADKLKVTSVMRDLLANINKTIVQLGGTIISDGVEFRIIEITNEGITVESVHPEQGWRCEQVVGVKRGF